MGLFESDAAVLPRRYGKYELLEHIGSGGMAEVFRARLAGVAGFEKIVVIKRLHPHYAADSNMVQMFVDEAKLAACVQHKNVVQVYELDRLENGEYYIVMEYVAGTDLKRLLRVAERKKRRLPPWLSVYTTIEVLDALAYAYDLTDASGRRRNIVHRDVSPENIFISSLGDVKLGDFGVAKDDTRTHEPFAKEVKGKLGYIAPEQLSGERLDMRCDVFAAGVVLWECLAQRRLFRGESPAATMALLTHARRTPPSELWPDVPTELDAIVLAALQPNRKKRIGSADEFQAQLLDVLATLRPGAGPVDVRGALAQILGDAKTARSEKQPRTEEITDALILGSTSIEAHEDEPLDRIDRAASDDIIFDLDGLHPAEEDTLDDIWGHSNDLPRGAELALPTEEPIEITVDERVPSFPEAAGRRAEPHVTPVLATPMPTPLPTATSTPGGQPEPQPSSSAVDKAETSAAGRGAMDPRTAAQEGRTRLRGASKTPAPEGTSGWDGTYAIINPRLRKTPVETDDIIRQRITYEIPIPGRPSNSETSDIVKGPIPPRLPPVAWEQTSAPPMVISPPPKDSIVFWLRLGAHRTAFGPCSFKDVASMLRSALAFDSSMRMELSPDGERWMPILQFLELSDRDFLDTREPPHAGPLSGTLAPPFRARSVSPRAEPDTRKETSLLALLAELAEHGVSGRLIVSREGQPVPDRAEIHIARGVPVHVTSNAPELETSELLVASRLIDATKMAECLHAVLMEERPLASILAERAGLDFLEHRPKIMLARLERILGWSGATFVFHPAAPAPAAPFARSTFALLIELIQRTHSPEHMAAALQPIAEAELERPEHLSTLLDRLGVGPAERAGLEPLLLARTLSEAVARAPVESRYLLAAAALLMEARALFTRAPALQ